MQSFDKNKIATIVSSVLFALITIQICYLYLGMDFDDLYSDPLALVLTLLLIIPYYIYIEKKFFPSIQKADAESYYKDLTDQLKDSQK